MAAFTQVTSRVVVLLRNDIDTDQIIPARFLKTITKTGLGERLFNDWRYDERGAPRPDFVLNQPAAKGAAVLLAGDNFGCGSSREHAPWALTDFGFRVVIARSFADIFRQNALKNGLVPVAVDESTHAELLRILAANPAAEVTVDLASKTLQLQGGVSVPFTVDDFARRCLLEGLDELGYLQSFATRIEAYEKQREEEVSR